MMKKAIVSVLVASSLVMAGWAYQERRNVVPPSAEKVAELLADTYSEETVLLVRVENEIQLDGTLYLQARDGKHMEINEVAHVFGAYIVLKEKLKHDYLIGSRIYQ